MPPRPPKPEVRAARPERKPSEWSPRPVPEPGIGRSTEDPRTPTLRELRQQAERTALTAAVVRAATWVALEYRHPDDGSPMAGAPYRATFADGSVREGTLGGDGTARLDGLPPALAGTAVEVAFGEAATAYQPLRERGESNPAYRGSETAFDDTLLQARPQLASAGGTEALRMVGRSRASFTPRVPEALGAAVDWVWGVIQGDFAEDPSNGQIVAGALVTMIPVVDQIADVRDIVANLARLRDPAERNDFASPAYLMLATTAVGVVPVVGSPAKGALRLALRNPKAGRGALFAVLRRLGRGDPEAFVRRHLTPGAIAAHAQRGLGVVQGKVHAVLAAMERVGQALGADRLVAAVQAFRREFAEVMAAARRGVQGAASTLGERVAAMTRRGDSDTRATGSTEGTVSGTPASADPPGAPGTGGGNGQPPGGPRDRGQATRNLQKRLDEHRAKLEAYRRDPYAFDSDGRLGKAPNDEIRNRVIQGRIRHLEAEIRAFEKGIRDAGGTPR